MPKTDKKIDYNALAQAIDTTWGRSSTPKGAGQSIKLALRGEKFLEVRYIAVVNLVDSREMATLKDKYIDEANQVINQSLKRVKDTYKEESDSTVKFKQISDNDMWEVINLNIYNGKKTAYFRRHVIYEMS